MIKRLPDNCSALYADLLQKAADSGLLILSGGSFTSKTISGAKYWYYQTKQVNGQRKQTCLGKETPELLEQIAGAKRRKTEASVILAERKRLVAMLSVGGATMEKGRPAKIIAGMAEAGLFVNGGTLVGSFAFACYGNMLGVSYLSDLSRTEDMDFSVDRRIEVGIRRNLAEALVQVDSTLKIPRQINPALKPFEMIASDGFKIEFLTTKATESEKAPVLIERFSIHAQPLDYMDFLIESNQPAMMLYGAGIPVVIPDPARFALHKLAVSQLRPISMKTKSDKDLKQASAILEVLLEDNPGLLILASDAVNSRQDLMVNLVRKGMALLPGEFRNALDEMLPEK